MPSFKDRLVWKRMALFFKFFRDMMNNGRNFNLLFGLFIAIVISLLLPLVVAGQEENDLILTINQLDDSSYPSILMLASVTDQASFLVFSAVSPSAFLQSTIHLVHPSVVSPNNQRPALPPSSLPDWRWACSPPICPSWAYAWPLL